MFVEDINGKFFRKHRLKFLGSEFRMQQKSADLLVLTKQERLLSHNLKTREYWSEQKNALGDDVFRDSSEQDSSTTPSRWIMTRDVTLYPWQEDCVNRWLERMNGTIKVVTGAGKTILALSIIEKLQAFNPDLRVAIVVPTIVLQDQWYNEILLRSNLSAHTIGRLGGGRSREVFNDDIRILLCVLNSAARYLPSIVSDSKVSSNLLLIADECHRTGAPDMSKVFQTQRRYNLGLSATPEREDGEGDFIDQDTASYDSSLLGRELGPIIYELTVYQALEQGILPEFEILHYGLPLIDKEHEEYQILSRKLRSVTSEFRELGHQYGIHDSGITRRSHSLAKREDPLGLIAREYLFLTNQRKRLLYNAKLRATAVSEILTTEFEQDPSTKAMLFHESIESVMLLYHQLLDLGFPVTVEHSELHETLRQTSLELFRDGTAQIVVSAKSLIEGFNVPETDIGIIVASSSSVRQRIQTIGRLLRKGKKSDKPARIYVIYMRDTVDENIYGKEDWNHLLGARRNQYFHMIEDGTLIEQKEPPRSPLPREDDLLLHTLTIGEEYPGAYEGLEYTCDSDGNVFTTDGKLIVNPQGVPKIIRQIKGGFGKFRVTQNKRYILALENQQEEWVVKFGGQLATPFIVEDESKDQPQVSDLDLDKLQIGESFQSELVGKQPQVVHFKQRQGKFVLARKEGRGERFARVGQQAKDTKKGDDAEKLIQVCREYRTIYPELSKIILTESGHALVLKDGSYRYLMTLQTGLEFS